MHTAVSRMLLLAIDIFEFGGTIGKMNKKLDEELMQMGEEKFWEEFNSREEAQANYVIVDDNGEIVVQNARLIKEKKKVRV